MGKISQSRIMLCQTPAILHTAPMRTLRLFALLSLSATSAILSSCGNGGGGSSGSISGTGPFDRNGNYVEAWADTPSKWGKKNSAPVSDDIPPTIASNEQPPSNAVPLSDSKPVEVMRSSSNPKPIRTTEVEVASRQKARSTEIASRQKSSESTSSKPKSRASQETASTKSKSKATAKTATKPKTSSPSRYVVKKGDSLSLIASRNKTSVSALQRANGISGTLIQPGKSLIIPR